jgi:hypothetical protein
MDEPAKFDLETVGKRLRFELIDTTRPLSALMLELLAKLHKAEAGACGEL